MNEVFLDTETTGLSVQEDHRIVEIACIETKDLIPTKKIFHKLINPERKVEEDALKIHGHTNEMLKEKKKFKDIANEFLQFIEGKKLIIHNASFDVSFLNHELKKIGKKTLNIKDVVDSLEIARTKYPGVSNSLDNLCKRFNIDLSKRTKHNALLDCELLREVYINLTEQKEPSLNLKEHISFGDDAKGFKKIRKEYAKIIIKPSNEEISHHKIFLKKEFKKNYF
ncbi:MAG: DNA polymerase III subunit epsilon [Pelagibacteraceae bacterium]|nr:DNA polymerase III subunit epsilon [Pelagibacteraceae bacterium]